MNFKERLYNLGSDDMAFEIEKGSTVFKFDYTSQYSKGVSIAKYELPSGWRFKRDLIYINHLLYYGHPMSFNDSGWFSRNNCVSDGILDIIMNIFELMKKKREAKEKKIEEEYNEEFRAELESLKDALKSKRKEIIRRF